MEPPTCHGRLNPDPYPALVSEVMLQQTQVTTVIPTSPSGCRHSRYRGLAKALEDHVMAIWQGLGYYSRARNLQKAARYLVDVCGAYFRTPIELQQILAWGATRRGAIMAFAYDEYGPIVDGTVKRLFCRLFGIEGQLSSSAVTNFWGWRTATPLNRQQGLRSGCFPTCATPAPRAPRCDECPFQLACVARQSDRVSQLPTPKAKKVIPTRTGVGSREQDGKLLLEKRPPEGLGWPLVSAGTPGAAGFARRHTQGAI